MTFRVNRVRCGGRVEKRGNVAVIIPLNSYRRVSALCDDRTFVNAVCATRARSPRQFVEQYDTAVGLATKGSPMTSSFCQSNLAGDSSVHTNGCGNAIGRLCSVRTAREDHWTVAGLPRKAHCSSVLVDIPHNP